MRARKRKEGDTLSFLVLLRFFSSSFFLLLLLLLLRLLFLLFFYRFFNIYSLTTYNSDPMDGLREIHFGERSLSLSHLYKNDSRRCIPLLLLVVVVVADLFAGLLGPYCWLCGDVVDALWWELRTPRDDGEPSTSKLESTKKRKD